VALVLLVVIAGGVLAGILYYTRNEERKAEMAKASLEAQKKLAEVAREKVAEDATLTNAKNRQEETLRDARAATNALQRLMVAADSARTDAEALKANDEGRRVALHPGLVRLARQLYEVNLPVLPAAADIVSRLEAVRRIEQQVLDAATTTFLPSPELIGEIQQATAWAGDQTRKTDEIRTLLRTLSQEAKVRVTSATATPNSPTLEAAIQRLTEAELSSQQQAIATKTEAARETATEKVAEAEIARRLREADIEAQRKVAAAEEKVAEFERQLAMKKAEQVKADTETKVAAETVIDEARNIELRKKAQDPAIQAKLKVFTTPGYWQVDNRTLDLKPHSFTKLKSRGALEPTTRGATQLVKIVTDKDDKVRPRWKMQAFYFMNYPEQIEQVKEAQALLNELGPILVELKMLEP
jgi:hypothetical protein